MDKQQASKQKTILYLVAEDHYFLSHRLPMARAAQQAGFKVMVAAPLGKTYAAIKTKGFEFYALRHFDRTSLQPVKEVLAIVELIKLYHSLQPDVVHHVAMKPVVYGSIAAFFNSSIRVINALGGLGYLFISTSMKAKILRLLIGFVLKNLLNRKQALCLLQNTDDQQTLHQAGFLQDGKSIIVPGSGVDTDYYNVMPEPATTIDGPVIAYVGRLLKDKGLCELIETIKILQAQNIVARFVWYGDVDLKNPASLSRQQVQQWHDEGLIDWRGSVADSREAYQHCHIAVLPSYREGLPKSLLEAASCARPIVTTDVPGCRDVVEHTITGFCVARDDMIKQMVKYLTQLLHNKNARMIMGQRGRQRVLDHFSETIIIERMRNIYKTYL